MTVQPEIGHEALMLGLLEDTCQTTQDKANRYAVYQIHEPVLLLGLLRRIQMLQELLTKLNSDQLFRAFLTLPEKESLLYLSYNFEAFASSIRLENTENPPRWLVGEMRLSAKRIADLIHNTAKNIWLKRIERTR